MKKFVLALAALCCLAAPKAANADFVLSLGPQVANTNNGGSGTFSVDILAAEAMGVGPVAYNFVGVTSTATDGGNSAFIDTMGGAIDINASFVLTGTAQKIGTFSFDVTSPFVGMISETTSFQIEATQVLPVPIGTGQAFGNLAGGVVSAVPEPASAALLGLGAFGLVLRRRRS